MTRSRIGAVCAVFILACTLLSLGPLCLLIEGNLQQTVHGRFDPGVGFSLQEGVPTLSDGEAPTPTDPRLRQGVTALIQPGYRLVLRLVRWELEAAVWLWDRVW